MYIDETTIIQVAIIVVLISLSNFCSGAETALSTVNRVTLKTMADDGDTRAARVLKVLDHYPKMLSAILIGNNVVNLSASALATTAIIRSMGESYVSLGTAILTVLIIMFGEITPKNAAKVKALDLAMKDAPIIAALMTVLTPVIAVVNVLENGLLRMMGIDPSQRTQMTESELKTYVQVGQEDGAIEGREKKIIYNVFDFGDAVAKDIMIPRIDMTCIPVDATYEDVLTVFQREMYTRLPVYDTDQDHIIGHINIKDFLLVQEPSAFKVRRFLHESYFTYEYKKTSDLLRDMQKKSYGIAFVLNEYGSTVGMITLEDLVEEIVGDIRDEYDDDEQLQLRRYDDLTYLADGAMKLIDINDELGTELDSEDYDSIGGLIIEHLERLPSNGETVVLSDGTSLTAKGIRRNRIVKVLIRFAVKPGLREEDESTEEASGDRDHKA